VAASVEQSVITDKWNVVFYQVIILLQIILKEKTKAVPTALADSFPSLSEKRPNLE